MNPMRIMRRNVRPRSGPVLRLASQQGFSLIEVLVTIVILVIGLLGLAGLQSKASVIEMESYQRAQALSLLKDMEDRIMSARGQLDVATGDPPVVTTQGFESFSSTDGSAVFGTGDGYTTATCAAVTNQAQQHLCQWGMALKGAAEVSGGTQVGAMIGARGCIIPASPTTDFALADFFVVVVWQGLTSTADPTAGTPAALCASGVNFGTGLRRAVVTRVMIPKLLG